MRIRYFIVAAILFACAACKKNIAVTPADFNVASAKNNGTETTVFTTKDTVQFRLAGNPDMITYFSGEPGKKYDFRSRVSAAGTPQLQFSTALTKGIQTNSLALMVSTDFKGVATYTSYGVLTRDTAATNANIAAATWTDITSRAALSTSTTVVPSGTIDLSDLSKGKPLYIAFKYTASAGSIQNSWSITGLTLNNVLSDGSTYTIANLNAPATAFTNYGVTTYAPGWAVSYDLAKNANKYAWVYTDKTSLVITGATTAAAATAPAEAWAVMGPIDLTRVTPDAGIAIKDITKTLTSYAYTYTTAGTYNAVFVSSNTRPGQTNAVVKEISLTVNP